MTKNETSVLRKPAQPVASTDPRESSRELLAIIRSLPDVVFKCEKRSNGKIYWTFNEGRLAEEFHLTTDLVRGKPLQEIFPPETVKKILPEFERAFEGRPREFTNELGGRYFKHFPQPVFDADGHVAAVVGFISEVTSLVLAEQKIERLNDQLSRHMDELAATNRELESFAYSVSHDLRTPLSGIKNWITLMEEQDSTHRGEASRRALDRIRSAIKRMDQTIDDLLRLSRSATEGIRCEPMDLGALARTVALETQERGPDRRVEWVVPDGLLVNADARLMRIALANLLGNAWKFTSTRSPARIEVGALGSGAQAVYYVRDNGCGFRPEEASTLFRAFRRLPSAQSFEGTGIGLATVKRVIERHKGRVWAEGKVDEGATIYFTFGDAP